MTSTLFNAADHRFMAEAIRLAWRGLYTTHPNPRVGCVLVNNGQIVGRGWHQTAGQGHAEVNAIADAAARGFDIKGATAYVSLEPCSHQGKTPPCANALIDAGVGKVISAMQDPNPLVSGRGHHMLQAGGIETACGLLQSQAEQINPGFNKRMRLGRPRVMVKSAMSMDGRTAMASGESQWITSAASRADVQRLRARVQAIVTGVETVIADNPAMTVRPQSWPQALDGDSQWSGWCWPQGVNPVQPLRVVLDSTLRTPVDAAILRQPGATLILCRELDAGKAIALEMAGAEVMQMPGQDKKQGIHLDAVLELLAQRQVNDVLVEAGSQLAGNFIDQGLTDEWICYVAPMLMGSSARPVLALPAIDTMAQARDLSSNLQLKASRSVGQDIRMTYLAVPTASTQETQ
ncbi:bifunctional diaminohydroxyphosphoribosylaminopyrimidine deaminase/5-amino-6-(5-phosphoribosylamino)uracil reductase RibD [Ketobacter sp. MCCC 1A13808]|uniref:bifunctional diaminohydroxyphosphoribosylaminopyrimidine deaminase/5-amino-6-(5-phosphoribosylamino)uracil reductase RibD n=1 Tax=Ketobacter sp. MCCC 1A13808 TaxID=2602738 RepID=UPI000F247288|nr:bifunctional diaminohydroxyphosphoribosylaminopyrimidine deaminase/5-amino-6-(5-phosphoribosylamino)uracil reductase RibD [Ketobacter sp. MCCC 1A13808]MVF11416.1 bifunctional diaminohydroxyphosphoribosylaminopyrimidine deaminase/5-amino-6-(5-phosphoribosylamino)uracil reductase RibD [Ketobacter sp. MCCC 1A13808]RLP54645.1 MAG: bifunctional diaminohydroxyphosphoribosylaminopyrimidine deaminase/5-amino-6-(5-phosphoribosylamino)uracil reductase RibD [Ketobacter sp.]